MDVFSYFAHLHGVLFLYGQSPSNTSSSFRNGLFIISFAVSCQPAVMDPSSFLMVDMMFPVFSLFATILYMMDHGWISVHVVFDIFFLWRSVLLPCIFEGSFGRHFVSSPWLLCLVFCSIFFHTDMYLHFYEIGSPLYYLPPSIYICFRNCSQALVIQFVNSVVASFGLRDLMIPFLLVHHVTFPNLLSLGCMTVFLVLLVIGQCLCRGLVL